jgi:hypothetical protein
MTVTYPVTGGVGVRAAVGLFACGPNVFSLVGIRARMPRIHLGVDIDHQFYWGTALSALVYPIQGKAVNWHIDTGVIVSSQSPMTNRSVARGWDFAIGTGLEIHLLSHVSATVDWRYSFPNLSVFRAYDDRILNTGNVMGNAFIQSQLMIGVMAHTW